MKNSIKQMLSLVLISSTMAMASCGGSSTTPTPSSNNLSDSDSGSADSGNGGLDESENTGGGVVPQYPFITPHIAPPDVAGSFYYRKGTNSALLTGPVLGTGEFDNADLTRDIPFELQTQPDPAIELLKVTFVQIEAASEASAGRRDVVFTLRNNSDDTVCGVDVSFNYHVGDERIISQGNSNPFKLIGEMIDVLATDDGAYSTQTGCLSAGALGYYRGEMRTDKDISLDNLNHVIIYGYSHVPSTNSRKQEVPVRSKLVPLSYSLANTSANEETQMILLVENQGESVLSRTFCTLVLLDDDNFPLSVQFSDSIFTPVPDISPGETAEVEIIEGDLTVGQSSQVRAICVGGIDP